MLVPKEAVGAVGVPENAGEANGAKPLPLTKAVVAILVELSPIDGVVDVGVPCSPGDDKGARVEKKKKKYLRTD